MYILSIHWTSNGRRELWEQSERSSEQSKSKRSIEEHGKYLIDLTCAAPETWISPTKTHAYATMCSFDLFSTFATLHHGLAFLRIIQGLRMDLKQDYPNQCLEEKQHFITALMEDPLKKVSSHAWSVYTQLLKKNCSKVFSRSFFNHLYHYANKNVSVKPLSLVCITPILTTTYSLINCSVYGRSYRNYSGKSFRFFWKEFR